MGPIAVLLLFVAWTNATAVLPLGYTLTPKLPLTTTVPVIANLPYTATLPVLTNVPVSVPSCGCGGIEIGSIVSLYDPCNFCAEELLTVVSPSCGCSETLVPLCGCDTGLLIGSDCGCVQNFGPISCGCAPNLAPISCGCTPNLAQISCGCGPNLAQISCGCAPNLAPISCGCVPNLAPISCGCVPNLAPITCGCSPAFGACGPSCLNLDPVTALGCTVPALPLVDVVPACGCNNLVNVCSCPTLPPFPPEVGCCGKYLRQICIPPPFL